MNSTTALDWQEHITAGQKYLKTARNGLRRPEVFDNNLIYHLTAMAIEQLLVGVWQYHRQLPADHTLEGLVDGLASICPLDSDLADGIKALGRFDDMCPLVPVNQCTPNNEQIRGILNLGQQVAAFAEREAFPRDSLLAGTV